MQPALDAATRSLGIAFLAIIGPVKNAIAAQFSHLLEQICQTLPLARVASGRRVWHANPCEAR